MEKVSTLSAHPLVFEQFSCLFSSFFNGLLFNPVHQGCGEPMECDSKMDNPGSPDREAGAEGGTDGMADCEGLKGGAEETEDSKKRKRKPYRPGEKCRLLQLSKL